MEDGSLIDGIVNRGTTVQYKNSDKGSMLISEDTENGIVSLGYDV
jgi:hypothetical protein